MSLLQSVTEQNTATPGNDRHNTEQSYYDVVICGAGWIGGLLAVALQQAGVRFALVEPRAISADPLLADRATVPQHGVVTGELRTLVLSPASRRILTALGLWERLAATVAPIERIHVSDRGHFGFTHLDAASLGMDALGHVVPGEVLERLFTEALLALPEGALWSGWRVVGMRNRGTCAEVIVHGGENGEQERTLITSLVVGADGARSQIRELAGIATTEHDYQQSAVVARIQPMQPHDNTAYERFTDTGPLALVPVDAQICGAIWAVPRAAAAGLLALPDAEFAAQLAERSGQRLGGIRRQPRRSYPLLFARAKEIIADRVMLAGNAAHTIHPNAAQGLNLGARDAAWIAEIVADTLGMGGDPGGEQALHRYRQVRQRDHDRVIAFSDGLTRLFYNDFPPAILVRDLAMLATDLFPPLKRTVIRRAMGLHGLQPRLVRGIPFAARTVG